MTTSLHAAIAASAAAGPFVDPWRPRPDALAVIYVAVHRGSGRRYVGYTSKPLVTRRNVHAQAAKGRSRNTIFGRCIRKYGIEAFDFAVVRECADVAEALDVERALIAAWKPDLNITEGGLGALGYRHSEAALAKMRAWRVANPDHKPRQGKLRPGAGLIGVETKRRKGPLRAWNAGVPASEETKAKLSAAKRGKLRKETPARRAQTVAAQAAACEARRKPVRCVNDGRTFESARAASAAYGLENTAVAQVARGRRASVFGRRFEYLGAADGYQ